MACSTISSESPSLSTIASAVEPANVLSSASWSIAAETVEVSTVSGVVVAGAASK